MSSERRILKSLRTAEERAAARAAAKNNSAGKKAIVAMENGSGKKAIVSMENSSEKKAIIAMENGSGKKAKVTAEAAPVSRAITITINSKLLECCVCFGPLIPPLFQCTRGHITSSECRTTMAFQCRMCLPEVDYVTRCPAMERVLGGLTMPCSFQENGCTEMVLYEERLNHEESCFHASCYCPIPGCRRRRYSGLSLRDHVDLEHPEITRTCVPVSCLHPLKMHEGEDAHVVCLDGGDHEDGDHVVFLVVADELSAPPAARVLSVVRLMTVLFQEPFQEEGYKYKIQVYAKSGVLSLSGETESVGRLTRPYKASASLIVPVAMWSPEDSPIYIELK